MANKLEDYGELKYKTTVTRLPYDPKKPLEGTFIGLLIKNPTQCSDILKNRLLYRDSKFARYYKPFRYTDKIFTTTIREKMDASEIATLSNDVKKLKLTLYTKPAGVRNKNIFVDTSDVSSAFLEHSKGKNYPILCKSYVRHLARYLKTVCAGLNHEHRYLILDTKSWGISTSNRSKVMSINQKMMNPISMFYELLKKDPEGLEPLKDYTLIILDDTFGLFYWDMSHTEKEISMKLYACMNKCKSKEINLDLSPETEEEKIEKEKEVEKIQQKEKEEEDKSSPRAVPTPASTTIVDKKEPKADLTEADPIKTQEELTEDEMELAKKAIDTNFQEMNRTAPENKRFQALRQKQKELKLDNISLGDLEDTSKIDYTIESDDISDKLFTPNKSVKKIRFDNINKSYNENVKDKDIINVFRSLNKKKNLPAVITNIKREDTSTPMDLKETWTVKLQTEDGVRHSVTVDIPKVYDNNYLYLAGNRKQFVNQQILKPLIKISADRVQVCTNYNKIFVYRLGDTVSPKVTIFKKIIANNPAIFKVKRGNGMGVNNGHMTSIEYDSLAKEFSGIAIRGKGIGLKFDQKFYDELRHDKKLEDINDDKYIYCVYDGRENAKIKAYVCPIESDGTEKDDGKETLNGPIDTFVHIYEKETGKNFWDLQGPKDKPGKRFMYSACKVMNKMIPSIIFLSYFEGLTTVMNKEGIQYHFTDKNPRDLGVDQAAIQFADGYLVYSLTPTAHSLLMSGLTFIDTKAYNYSDFDTQMPYLDFFDMKYSNRALASGLDAYYDNMIDPISEEILKQMDLPTDFVQLMLAASDLLSDNASSSELSLTEFRVRNLEMISAYLYKALSASYSNYKRKAKYATPEKISLAKDAIIKEILTSNVVEDVSIINPITEKEKERAITCKGPSGINLERSYTKEKRCFDQTMIGCMTISTSPDANCGVVRELTIDPKVTNTRGFIDCKESPDQMDQTKLFGYSELVNGIGVTMDDAIRTAMASKQNKHLIPVKDMCPVLLSTGIEKAMPYMASKDFVIKAQDDGKIVEFDQKTNMMIAEYKNGEHEAINLNGIMVKNAGGGFYLENKMLPMYKVGQRFKKDDILAQNKDYYSYHYDGAKFNLGTLSKIAIMSSFATFEDSNMITEGLSKRMGTEMVMQKHIILGPNATVSQIVNVGDKILVGQPLITYEQSADEESVNRLLRGIGKDLREDIKSMAKNTLTSKYSGVVDEIRIYSTEEISELSKSLGAIVDKYWKGIREKKKLIRKYKITDPSDQGSTFYEIDGPVKPNAAGAVKGYKIEHGVIIEFYIKFTDNMKPGDKMTHHLALKGTVALVIPDDQAPYTLDRPNEPIESCIPATSVLARQTIGILPTMFSQKLLVELKHQLKDMYEKG